MLFLTVVLGLTACSTGSNAPATTTPPGSAPTTSALFTAPQPAASASGSVSADDCAGAVGHISKAVAGFPQVSKIMMIAACGEASISTTLPPGVLGSSSATTGVKICAAAASVAYQGKVSSVTVVATDGSELAIGLKGSDCIP